MLKKKKAGKTELPKSDASRIAGQLVILDTLIGKLDEVALAIARIMHDMEDRLDAELKS